MVEVYTDDITQTSASSMQGCNPTYLVTFHIDSSCEIPEPFDPYNDLNMITSMP